MTAAARDLPRRVGGTAHRGAGRAISRTPGRDGRASRAGTSCPEAREAPRSKRASTSAVDRCSSGILRATSSWSPTEASSRSALHRVVGRPSRGLFPFRISNASITVIEKRDGRMVIAGVNDIGHLEGTPQGERREPVGLRHWSARTTPRRAAAADLGVGRGPGEGGMGGRARAPRTTRWRVCRCAGSVRVREAYVPRGPVPATAEAVERLLEWARERKVARLRIEPEAPPRAG